MTVNAPDPSAPSTAPADLLDALVQSSFVTMAALSRIGAEHDLSLTQLRVLGILRDRRLRMSQLAGYLGLDRSTLSGLVERAEKRGLLQRSPNDVDGRAIDVLLTVAGRQLGERLQRQAQEALGPLTAGLSGVERARLTALLQQVLAGTADG